MKRIVATKKYIIMFVIILNLILLSGCNFNMYLTELMNLDTENIEEIMIYKKNHAISIFDEDEDLILKMVEITDKDKIEEFVIEFEEIKILNDPHTSDRFNYDFDNNYIYVDIADKTLIFVENEVYYDVHYTIKNVGAVKFIKELIESDY